MWSRTFNVLALATKFRSACCCTAGYRSRCPTSHDAEVLASAFGYLRSAGCIRGAVAFAILMLFFLSDVLRVPSLASKQNAFRG
mmetsp:Transcript_72165/g.120151  ORF Transcript_72165/g.120151 Transcript_72165/m.120151 type:complete len:84 (+) Transcript_72165:2813-3064(+)